MRGFGGWVPCSWGSEHEPIAKLSANMEAHTRGCLAFGCVYLVGFKSSHLSNPCTTEPRSYSSHTTGTFLFSVCIVAKIIDLTMPFTIPSGTS